VLEESKGQATACKRGVGVKKSPSQVFSRGVHLLHGGMRGGKQVKKVEDLNLQLRTTSGVQSSEKKKGSERGILGVVLPGGGNKIASDREKSQWELGGWTRG